MTECVLLQVTYKWQTSSQIGNKGLLMVGGAPSEGEEILDRDGNQDFVGSDDDACTKWPGTCFYLFAFIFWTWGVDRAVI